jgi:hypothetical protein
MSTAGTAFHCRNTAQLRNISPANKNGCLCYRKRPLIQLQEQLLRQEHLPRYRKVYPLQEQFHQQHDQVPLLQEQPPLLRNSCLNYKKVLPSTGRCGGLMVAHQTVVLQSRVLIRHLPSPQLTANLLVGCRLGLHLAAS